MEESNRKTELLVGLFLTCGLALLGLLILQFSAVRELFKHTYDLTVPFPDGTGIKVGTPVMLGGSRIGKVSDRPRLNESFNGVIIPLEIYETVKIPVDAKFGIGTAGLLGDSYVEIRPTGSNTQEYIQPGAIISNDQIVSASGLGGLQDAALNIGKKVDVAIEDIRLAVSDLRLSLKRINEGALSEQSSTDLRGAIASLNHLVKRLDEDTLGEKTGQEFKDAVTSFKNTAQSLEQSMKKLDPAIDKLDSAFEKTDTLLTSADGAMKSIDTSAKAIGGVATDIRRGDGLLPALLHDASLRREFSNLITNLRQRGVLFYKDKSGASESDQAPSRPRSFGPRPLGGTKR